MAEKFPRIHLAKPRPFPVAATLTIKGHRRHNCPVCRAASTYEGGAKHD